MSTEPESGELIPEKPSDWSVDEIELAYQKALEAFDESAELRVGEGDSEAEESLADSPSPTDLGERAGVESALADPGAASIAFDDPQPAQESEPAIPARRIDPVPTESMRPAADLNSASPAEKKNGKRSRDHSKGDISPKPADPSLTAKDQIDATVTPAQVIEAALFVGGQPLTAGKLYALLRGTISVEQVPGLVDELNSLYAAQGRPYEIRLGDGGYRLELKPEFERLKMRVFGQGPREVKLAQDALEVLALVAYRQPISQEEIEGHGKTAPGNLLRQLLRRDLVQIERGENGPRNVRYRTTARFLSVFGLANLAELPQPEDLAAR